MITVLFFIWLYIGMYSFIFWISKHNKRYRLRWRTMDVALIPMFAILGPIMFIAGFILYKQKS
jgi:hypothetical protein